jgi:tRNA-Thr(GGU) m(6)t(6)A37 methyltransferase TsaA
MAGQSMKLEPIGFVRNEMEEKPERGFDWRQIVSEIIIEPRLTEGLDSLDDFSHVIVISWMHQATEKDKMALKVHPRGRKELAPVGVFASRSPYRPNPLGKATVRLLERRGNILKVQGLDFINGTPVIDIKPYIPGHDLAEGATTPPWVQKH